MLEWVKQDGAPIDPCIAFRLNEMQRFYLAVSFDDAWWTAVLELQGISINELIGGPKDIGLGLRVPAFYGEQALDAPPEVPYVSTLAQRDFLSAANAQFNRLQISRMELSSIVTDSALPAEPVPLPVGETISVPDGTVVIGVMDSGVAFANYLFRFPDNKTGVQLAWIIDAEPPDGVAPQDRQFDNGEIDALIAANIHAGPLDEDTFYREVGLINFTQPGFKPASLRLSHGTHTA